MTNGILQSDNINELVAALAKAQAGLTAPARNREVEVVSKRTGGRYKFSYTTLDAIIEHVREPLTTNGLWFVQSLAKDEGRYSLLTKLVHSSGQWMASETPILAETKDNQDFGAAITYMKRYSLAAMLGVAADEDTDGQSGEGKKEKQPIKPKPKTPEEAADAWISDALSVIGSFTMRGQYQQWKKENQRFIDKLAKDHETKSLAFSDKVEELIAGLQ